MTLVSGEDDFAVSSDPCKVEIGRGETGMVGLGGRETFWAMVGLSREVN